MTGGVRNSRLSVSTPEIDSRVAIRRGWMGLRFKDELARRTSEIRDFMLIEQNDRTIGKSRTFLYEAPRFELSMRPRNVRPRSYWNGQR